MEYRNLGLLLLFCLLQLALAKPKSKEKDINELEGPNFGARAKRPLGRPYQDWKLSCDRRRSIGGFKSRVYVSTISGTDVLVRSFCRSIAHRKDPILRVSDRDCRLTEPFSLQGDNVTLEDTVRNCADGEFVRAIHSDYDNGTRMVNMQCCKPINAEIDQFVGCNTEGPIYLFDTYHGFLKDPYDPRADCPRDALVGLTYADGGLSFKYCPFRIDARNYLSTCPEIKKGILLGAAGDGDGAGGVDGEVAGQGVDSLYRLREEQWSGVHQSWRFECKGTKVIKAIRVGFAFHPDEVRRDVLWQFVCGKQLDEPQYSKKVRVTSWTAISWKDQTLENYGCKDNEALIGVASIFQADEEKRYMSLICAEMSNADLDEESIREDEIVLKWGQIKEAAAADDESLRNLAVKLEGTEKVSLLPVYAKFVYVEETKFEVSSRTDDNTGETIEPWPLELDVPVSANQLPMVNPDEWTPVGDSWRVQCKDFEVLQKFSVKQDGEDVSAKLTCTTQVEGEQTARIVRYTKWMLLQQMAADGGCRDNEALQGIMSYYDEDKIRYISLICIDNSNSESEGTAEEKSTEVGGEYEYVGAEGSVANNVFTSTTASVITMTATFIKYTYVEKPRFEQSQLVDEIDSVTSPILDVNVEDLPKLDSGAWSAKEENFYFECGPGNFEAITTSYGRAKILEDGSDDLEFKFECGPVLTEGENAATAARWTNWMELHSMKIKLGCKDTEVVQGVGGYWDPDSKSRFYSFLCTEGSNAQLAEGPRVVEFIIKEGFENGTQMNGTAEEGERPEIIQNMLASKFIYRLVRTHYALYLARFKFVEEAKFTESTRSNDASGESKTEIKVDPAAVEGNMLELDETEWSESGTDFKFSCDPEYAVVEETVRIVPWEAEEGKYDIVFKFKCKKILDSESAAYNLRNTKYVFVREMEADLGCGETELLHGFKSFIEPESKNRFVSLVCVELSNANAVLVHDGPYNYTTSRDKTEIVHEEEIHIMNQYTEINEENIMSVVFTFGKFEAVSDQFTACRELNDNNGDIVPIEDCGDPEGTTGGIAGGDGGGGPGGAGPGGAGPGAGGGGTDPLLEGEKGEGFCALDGVCPSWWNFNKDCPKLYGCYRVFQIGKLSWDDANDICFTKYKGRLAQFETHAKWEHMKEHLLRDGKRFWMGIKRPAGVSGFPQWFDGSPINFEPWMPSDPNNDRTNEVCGLLRNQEWYDDVCHSSWNEGFICEIP